MATPNYSFQKRQKELAKQRKKEDKLKRKSEDKPDENATQENGDSDAVPAEPNQVA
jgi:hypothetical protein